MDAILILAGLGILALLAEIVNFKKLIIPLVLLGIVGAIVSVVVEFDFNYNLQNMMHFDRYAMSFILLMLIVTLLWILINFNFFSDFTNETDHLSLILFSVVGGLCLASYTNFVMFFLGIEILSIPMYVLAGSNKRNLESNEAALKYFLMGSFATGVMLFGIVLIYGTTGTFDLYTMRMKVSSEGFVATPMFTVGIVMLMAAMAFKTASAPFHFWAPDVYSGSPTSVTAFMASFVKVAAFAALMRLFYTALPSVPGAYPNLLLLLIIASLFIGNIIAAYQTNTKRMLAYSSISHAGFLMMAILCFSNTQSIHALFFYAAAYAITSLAAFMVLKIVGENGGGEDIASFQGLVKRNPLLAGTMTVAMLSMAGIPPVSGFFAKYYMLSLAISNGYTWVAVIGILASLVGVYYYFKVIIAMFSKQGEAEAISTSVLQKVILVVLNIAVIGMGLISAIYSII